MLAASTVANADELDDVLSGFDDDEAADATGDPAPDDADDDALDGFEDDADTPARRPESVREERIWDLTGSVGVSASVAYLQHDAADGRDYRGLTRLRRRYTLSTLAVAWRAAMLPTT